MSGRSTSSVSAANKLVQKEKGVKVVGSNIEVPVSVRIQNAFNSLLEEEELNRGRDDDQDNGYGYIEPTLKFERKDVNIVTSNPKKTIKSVPKQQQPIKSVPQPVKQEPKNTEQPKITTPIIAKESNSTSPLTKKELKQFKQVLEEEIFIASPTQEVVNEFGQQGTFSESFSIAASPSVLIQDQEKIATNFDFRNLAHPSTSQTVDNFKSATNTNLDKLNNSTLITQNVKKDVMQDFEQSVNAKGAQKNKHINVDSSVHSDASLEEEDKEILRAQQSFQLGFIDQSSFDKIKSDFLLVKSNRLRLQSLADKELLLKKQQLESDESHRKQLKQQEYLANIEFDRISNIKQRINAMFGSLPYDTQRHIRNMIKTFDSDLEKSRNLDHILPVVQNFYEIQLKKDAEPGSTTKQSNNTTKTKNTANTKGNNKRNKGNNKGGGSMLKGSFAVSGAVGMQILDVTDKHHFVTMKGGGEVTRQDVIPNREMMDLIERISVKNPDRVRQFLKEVKLARKMRVEQQKMIRDRLATITKDQVYN